MDDNNINLSIVNGLTSNAKGIFKGVFTSDELNNIHITSDIFDDNNPRSLVFNTVRRVGDSRIGHWLSISTMYSSNIGILKLTYFDSFAQSFKKQNKSINNFINNIKVSCHNRNIKFVLEEINRQIQNNKSAVCGAYCVYVIINSHERPSSSLNRIFVNFKGNTKNNDTKILKYIISVWPSESCNNMSHNSSDKLSLDFIIKNIYIYKPNFCPKYTFLNKENKCLKMCKCPMCCKDNHTL